MSKPKLTIHTHHWAGSIPHAIKVTGVPEGKTVQVFVYSYRTGLYYPQHPAHQRVLLGDVIHEMGRYKIAAVILEGKANWNPVSTLPAGEKTETHSIWRLGIL